MNVVRYSELWDLLIRWENITNGFLTQLNLEYKFRYLSKNYKTKVCCIFDVCRSDLKKLFIENKPIFASGAVAGELACEAAAREKGSAEGENAGGKAGLKAGEAKH